MAKKTAAKKAPAKKTAKKAAPKKKAPAKKAATKKKAAAKKPAAKAKAATRASVKKATPKKTAAKKVASKMPATKKAATKKKPATKKAAAKKTATKKAATKKAATKKAPAKKPAVEVWGIKQCQSTRKAEKLLDRNKVNYAFRDLKEEKPPKTLLRDALKGVDNFKKAFNTSGAAYQKGNWKNKVDSLNKEQAVSALASDPMLIKRPIVKGKKDVTIGFDEPAIKKAVK